jgi:pimeloyl-ACP methyl ester carboxylesterase
MPEQPQHHYVLVPGFWLGGWVWDKVANRLRAAGQRVTPLTLPGLESKDADRRNITLDDHVRAVADAVSGADTILVAHSAAGALASAVLDRDPASVGRAVYVDSGPVADGWVQEPGLSEDAVEVPLPAWETMLENGISLEGLTVSDLEELSRRAVPHPARVASATVHLTNPQRLAVPATVITCSMRSDDVREMAAEGMPMFAELARLHDLTFLDLPTGHWPMLSKPEDLAEALLHVSDGLVAG